MKTIDLSNYETKELTDEQSVAVQGGNLLIAAGITHVLFAAFTNPQAHIDALVQGFKEGYNATKVE